MIARQYPKEHAHTAFCRISAIYFAEFICQDDADVQFSIETLDTDSVLSQFEGLLAGSQREGGTPCYCPSCDKPAYMRNKFCVSHKNAKAAMETQVWRGYKKKDELTQEQEDWRQVFGYGKACPGKPAEAEWL